MSANEHEATRGSTAIGIRAGTGFRRRPAPGAWCRIILAAAAIGVLGSDSTALGTNNKAGSGAGVIGSTAVGARNTSSGDQSSSLGYRNEATGDNSTALGVSNESSGTGSSSLGNLNTASGLNSTALGGYECIFRRPEHQPGCSEHIFGGTQQQPRCGQYGQ